ncbi:MAG: aminotransferase class I/II-fold pyridoxal phosphate-dependent enzyme [Anaerolineae bacterium]|nr:aminotransferase class I/II-fold pyridoxal phosphate-dependent enzyme [Anaerolineae bacterium]
MTKPIPGNTPSDQSATPFLDNLVSEQQLAAMSFHMPGHKRTFKSLPKLIEYWGGDLFLADLVEIDGSIDYLHAPKGSLREAQALAAQAYGADQTFFLINGSTVGNLCALMSTAHEGDKVLMSRASHRSVYGGLVLSGAEPVYIEPMYHPKVGFPLGILPEAVQQKLEQNPDIAAVHITTPNYYGYLSDVKTLARMAHAHNAVLIVDEAHGAHLTFHPLLPASALHNGADMVIQSTHKTLSALTQASMLHCAGNRVNRARVAQNQSLLQSSSPSSILLASLDVARMQMATHGEELLTQTLALAQSARAQIPEIDGLWCYGEDLVGNYGIYAYDPTKLVIRVTDSGVSGFEAAHKLRQESMLDVEFADVRHIICSITIGDTEQSIHTLIQSLRQLVAKAQPNSEPQPIIEPPAALPSIGIRPRDAYFAPSKMIPLEQSLGEICAENIIPYPPGIPLLVPGEIIDRDMLDYMRYIVRAGATIVGAEDRSLNAIRVVAQS